MVRGKKENTNLIFLKFGALSDFLEGQLPVVCWPCESHLSDNHLLFVIIGLTTIQLQKKLSWVF